MLKEDDIMPIMNKLPVGGGGSAEPGIRDGQGIVKLNIFTQSNEPTTKDGIWIKTNNKYQKVMINQKYANESGIWSNDVGPLPYQIGSGGSGSAVVYNGEIHIFGSRNWEHAKCHYKYNGSTWSSVSSLPYLFDYGSAVVYNGEIHILGGSNPSGTYTKYHYKYNGSTWSIDVRSSRSISRNMAVLYNNEIHTFYSSAGNIDHYKYDGSSWTKASTFPYTDYNRSYIFSIAYNNSEIHLFIFNNDNTSSHYRFKSSTKSYNDNTVIIYRGNNTNNGAYLTSMANMSVIEGNGSNNRFVSGFDDVLYFASSAFNWYAPMYYGNGTQWIKFKN